MKYLYILVSLIFIGLSTNCFQQNLSNKNISTFFAFFNINNPDTILQTQNMINEKLICYDTIKKEISLLKLTDYQKSISIDKILSNNYPICEAYLVGVQERVPKVYTVIVYIYTNYTAPMYLINYKDTVLVDYIYHDGSYVYDVIEDTDSKEIIYGYQRWFELHQDTVYRIENNIQSEYYSNTEKQIEKSKNSTIIKYKIEESGMFKQIFPLQITP